ncbi:MAG TPA: glycosyltransferase N-terminal domain-containing protein [Ignavibacteriaceae bacterium]|jgi:3-deoxy-D-manno-octulosonic-acid transferase
MKVIWQIIYNFIFLPVFYLLIRFASLFSQKIRRGIRGRRKIFEDLIISRISIDKSKKNIWFHSSSLGEFEQAKPIIEELRKTKRVNIIVSFFSPSGFENSRKYPYADLITYLPFDSKEKSEKFISIVQPDLAVFMRYDIWPNHIWALARKKIPCFLVDATMRSGSPRKWPLIKSFHKNLFVDIKKILAISESDATGFRSFNCSAEQVNVVGDTRFDRVYKKSLDAKTSKLINPEILNGKIILVAGSTWEQDEDVIIPVFQKLTKYNENILLMIAPHEPTLLHLEKIENEFQRTNNSIRFSHLNTYSNENVIIIDSIGILLTLYNYADVAFIGGSFKQNVHNVLEAAVYGIPVLFGPKIANSQEAIQLADNGGGIVVQNKLDAYRKLRILIKDSEIRKSRGKIAFDFVQKNVSATEKILKEIYSVI